MRGGGDLNARVTWGNVQSVFVNERIIYVIDCTRL